MKTGRYRIIALGLVCALDTLAAGLSQNIRVVWSAHPQTEAVVVWDSEVAIGSCKLLLDTVSREAAARDYAFHIPITESGLYTEGAPNEASTNYFYHHAPLKNLTPDTVYYLAVKTDAGVGREYHFKTAPAGNKPFKLIYGGDSRSRLDVARQINIQIREMITQDESIIALLHGGDYAVTTFRSVWKEWLEAYALTTTKAGKLLPIIPIVGNHDVVGASPIFRQAYGYPGGENDYYLCRLTPSVGLLCLNTEIDAAGAQQKFLAASLDTLKKEKVKWQIAAFHRPIYPAVKQPAAAKASWVPLFEEFNIDLALESDGHCIKRTLPIRAEKEAVDGIVYLGEGGYGAPQRDPQSTRWYLQGDHAFSSKGDHVMMLEIAPSAIHYSTILSNGKVVDSATFKPRR